MPYSPAARTWTTIGVAEAPARHVDLEPGAHLRDLPAHARRRAAVLGQRVLGQVRRLHRVGAGERPAGSTMLAVPLAPRLALKATPSTENTTSPAPGPAGVVTAADAVTGWP